ncbi:hypothetical protein AMTRI_Chr02g217700 [Amborella trichopoda]
MCVCLCVCFKVIFVASFVKFIAFCSLSLALFVKFGAVYSHSLYLCFLNDTNCEFCEMGLELEIGNARKVFDKMEGEHRKLCSHKGKFYVPRPYYHSLYLCFLNYTNFVKFRAMKV